MIHQKQWIYQTLLKIKNFFSVKDTAQRIKNQIQNMRKYLQNTFHKIICFRYRKNSKLKAIQFYLFIVCTYFFIHWFIFGCVRASLWHVGSFVAACGLLSKCGSQVPDVCGLSSYIAEVWLSCGMRDLSSPTRNQTCIPCIRRWILNHWTTREVPQF